MSEPLPKLVLAPERYYRWLDWRRVRIGLTKNQFNDLFREARGLTEKRNFLRNTGATLDTVFAGGGALASLEAAHGVPEGSRANPVMALLAAGCYIDWAVAVASVIADDRLDPFDRLAAVVHCSLPERIPKGGLASPMGYNVPDYDWYLLDKRSGDKLSIANPGPFLSAFERWNQSRLIDAVPAGSVSAIRAFENRDVAAGLFLMVLFADTYFAQISPSSGEV
jgi:hypothetical protein